MEGRLPVHTRHFGRRGRQAAIAFVSSPIEIYRHCRTNNANYRELLRTCFIVTSIGFIVQLYDPIYIYVSAVAVERMFLHTTTSTAKVINGNNSPAELEVYVDSALCVKSQS